MYIVSNEPIRRIRSVHKEGDEWFFENGQKSNYRENEMFDTPRKAFEKLLSEKLSELRLEKHNVLLAQGRIDDLEDDINELQETVRRMK